MSISLNTQQAVVSETGDPHMIRRHEMIKKYPEIKKLYGYDRRIAFCYRLSPLYSATLSGFVCASKILTTCE